MRFSIIGFGDFGKLTARHLARKHDVVVYNRNNAKTDVILATGSKPVAFEEAARADVIILAITLDALEETLEHLAPLLTTDTLIVDVTSVKVKPVEMMKRLLPEHVQILATHPLFGPVTASENLTGHKIVIDPIRVKNEAAIETFLKGLGLKVVRMSAEEHDREMAWVHALTFFVGRGLMNINPPLSDITTNYYNELLDLVNVEKTHSKELFYTIQRGNPYADEMRQRFIASLQALEKDIKAQ